VSIRSRLQAGLTAALLGVSAYQSAPGYGPTLGDTNIEEALDATQGQLTPLPQTRLRWYIADLETAIHRADEGNLQMAGELWAAMKRDGTLCGILSTLVSGLVHLPRRMSGRADIVAELEGRDGVTERYDAMFPPSELEKIVEDGIGMGVAVGYFAPVAGRSYPVFVRLDPRWLVYRWNENRWYYTSVVGSLPITPGDGRWVLWTFGARTAPWQSGVWYSLGIAWVNKQHAMLHKANWEAKLANPARVAVMPQGASEQQKQSWFGRVMAWGANSVFGAPPGYDVKLVESNGRGYESFDTTIERSDREFMIGIAGQVITTTGGTGFSNMDLYRSIRADLIQSTERKLAYGINTQGIPQYVATHHGEDALEQTVVVKYDTTPPKDLKEDAAAQAQLGTAITAANQALAPYQLRVDVKPLAARTGLPLERVDGVSLAEEAADMPGEVIDQEDELARDEEDAEDYAEAA
jgi:hypothetical protein